MYTYLLQISRVLPDSHSSRAGVPKLYLSYDVVSEDVITLLHRPEIPFLMLGGYILLYGGPLFGKKGSGTPAW